MRKPAWVKHSLLTLYLASSCAAAHQAAAASPRDGRQIGIASYYSDKFHGRRTASGERYDRNALTAVHPRLPFGAVIHVTNLRNHRSVDLRVNDRRRLRRGRVLDVSRRAAQLLGFVGAGLARVEIEVLKGDDS